MLTRLPSCARLGLARLVTTAVVCGAAVLFLPTPCDGAVASDASEPGMTVAPDEIAGQLPGSSDQAMTGSARFSESDPTDDDSDDDDDGDDSGPGGPAAAADVAALVGDSGEGAVMTSDIALGSLTPLDGCSLRGPPRVESDDISIDFDDDDDDSSESSHGRATARQFQHLHHFASHSEPARRRVPDGPQLRAP